VEEATEEAVPQEAAEAEAVPEVGAAAQPQASQMNQRKEACVPLWDHMCLTMVTKVQPTK